MQSLLGHCSPSDPREAGWKNVPCPSERAKSVRHGVLGCCSPQHCQWQGHQTRRYSFSSVEGLIPSPPQQGLPSKPQDSPSPSEQRKLVIHVAAQTPFPRSQDFGLPKEFQGRRVTEYLEYFDDACDDFGITSDNDKARKWESWCDADTRAIVRNLRVKDKQADWTTFREKLCKHWKHRDPRQSSNAMLKLQEFYTKRIESTASALVDALEEQDHLIARLPAKHIAQAEANAAILFWTKLSDILQVGLLCRGKRKKEIYAMEHTEFRNWLLKIAVEGFLVGDCFQKFDTTAAASDGQESEAEPAAPSKQMMLDMTVEDFLAIRYLRQKTLYRQGELSGC